MLAVLSIDLKPTATTAETEARNGHKKLRIRCLSDDERSIIRNDFIARNGQYSEDDCVRIKSTLPPDISIFQVTGFVSFLHRGVLKGTHMVHNKQKYDIWMQIKYNPQRRFNYVALR
jgi:hypothetical protein